MISDMIRVGRDPRPELDAEDRQHIQHLVSKYLRWVQKKGRTPAIIFSTFGRLGATDKSWHVSSIIIDEISQVNP